MKAIILAAGIGSRLRPITNYKPKTLVKVNDKPMLGYILENLRKNRIRNIVLCTGFKSELIANYCNSNYPDLPITYVENKDFENTNNMYSLYLAKDYMDEDILLMNADLVYEADIIKGLIDQKVSSIAVDKGSYNPESMKIVVENNTAKRISKKIDEFEAYGCSIDVYKIKKEDLIEIQSEMKEIIEDKGDLNQWTEVMLDNLLKSGKIIMQPYDINPAKWFEIDNFEDLATAELLFNRNIPEIENKKIFFIDKDGTLVLKNQKIDGIDEFLNKLNDKEKIFYIITNNSSKTPDEHYEALKNMGLNISSTNVLVSIQSALTFLREKGFLNIFWVATENVSKYIRSEGFVFDDKQPQALLLTYDTEIYYEKLEKLTHFIRKGVPYYATHTDMVCPTPTGPVPDIGTFIEVIRLTTGIMPVKTFGKPEKSLIDPILKKHNCKYEDAVVIGDRLYTDIKLAEDSDLTSVLTLTGEINREEYEESQIRADIVIKDLATLSKYV